MAYNLPTSYKDQTPGKGLDKKTLNKMVWRSLFLQASFNFERMQAAGWLYGILPGLEKIHTNKDDLSASMTHNLEFFNTHPFLVTFVMGIVLSLEENKADIQTIRAVRVSAMGPLGGIGDALFWFTLVPIVAGMTSNMALQGSFAAPFIFLAVFNIAQFALRYGLMHWSYKMGTQAIDILTQNSKEFTRAASILGVIVVGALTCLYGGTTTRYEIPSGEKAVLTERVLTVKNEEVAALTYPNAELDNDKNPKVSTTDLGNGYTEVKYNTVSNEKNTIKIQKILDGIIPKAIPLSLTMLLYFLLAKKKWTPVAGIVLLLFIGIIGAAVGIF